MKKLIALVLTLLLVPTLALAATEYDVTCLLYTSRCV